MIKGEDVGMISKQTIGGMDWYQAAVDLLPGGMGIYEVTDGAISSVYANDGIVHLLEGYTPDEMKRLSKSVEELIYRRDLPKLRAQVHESIVKNQLIDCYVRYYRSPKTIGWLWIRGEKIKDTDGKAVFFVLLLDATRSKEMENNLLIQQQRYEILEETSSEMLFEIDPVKDTMEYTLKEIDGSFKRNVIENYSESLLKSPMVHPDYMNEFMDHLMHAVQETTSGKMEYLSSISGNGYEWHRLTYKSIEDETGNVIAVFGRIKNIHDEVLRKQILKAQSDIDQMTNLYNKNYLIKRIHRKMDESDFDCRHTLVLVGIEQFSKIVEQNGHACGDMVIQTVSKCFQKTLEGISLFGRKGNEKFMAYLENVDNEIIDEKMKEFLSMLVLPENQVADILINCSVGVASIIGVVDYEVLYEKADEALYLARITRDTDYIRV